MKKSEDITKFSKDQIVKSNRFKEYNRDVLNAILNGDNLYSIEEAETVIKEFLERLV